VTGVFLMFEEEGFVGVVGEGNEGVNSK